MASLIPGEEYPGAEEFIPEGADLPELREAVQACRGCPLWATGTQAVFGEGPSQTPVMLIGEQPGDKEDLAGRPFIGPAGHLLEECLEKAGLERQQVYVTNAVKHFKWVQSGARRLHQKPKSREIKACQPWLMREIEEVNPEVLVCLGATAAQSLLGSSFKLTPNRGKFLDVIPKRQIMATFHPSALLRMPDPESRLQAREAFIADLKLVAHLVSR
jgi:uracil-DNA glycosylase